MGVITPGGFQKVVVTFFGPLFMNESKKTPIFK